MPILIDHDENTYRLKNDFLIKKSIFIEEYKQFNLYISYSKYDHRKNDFYDHHYIISLTKKNSKQEQLKLRIFKESQKEYRIVDVYGKKGFEVKAYELYYHLIKNHNFVIISDTKHSLGGMYIWKNLSKFNDIKIVHYDKQFNEMKLEINDRFKYNYNIDSFFKGMKK